MSKTEEKTFHEKVYKIDTEDPVEQAILLIEALDNPHAIFYKKSDESSENKQDMVPTAEVIENILVIHVPKLNKNINELTNLFDKHSGGSEGLIIDLQDCIGGAESTAIELQKRLVPRGTYEFGTNIVMAPEGAFTPIKCTFISENDQPYEKPIVVLTSDITHSSAERFLTSLRVSRNITVIGTSTCGGSANPETREIDINGETYVVKFPRWRFIPKGETKPIEETKIRPDIYYDKPDILDYAIKNIKDLER